MAGGRRTPAGRRLPTGSGTPARSPSRPTPFLTRRQVTVGRVDLRFSAEDETFRAEVRDWLGEHLVGEFAALGDAGGPGREHEGFDTRREWERLLGEHGWIGLGWPTQHGGGAAPLTQQGGLHEEYARPPAPHRGNHIGVAPPCAAVLVASS